MSQGRLSVIVITGKADEEGAPLPGPTHLLLPSHSWVYDRFMLFPFNDLSSISLVSGDHSISMLFPFVQPVQLSVACLCFHSSVTWLSSSLPGDARLP